METKLAVFTNALYQLLILTKYPQEKISDFINQTTINAYIDSALDLSDSLSDEERVRFSQQLENKSALEIRKLLIEKFEVEKMNNIFAQNLDSTLDRFIDHVSKNLNEEQKKILQDIKQEYLAHTIV